MHTYAYTHTHTSTHTRTHIHTYTHTHTHMHAQIFEVEDLSVASPATVSRVGIIYLEPSTSVGTAAMVDSWLLTLPEVYQSVAVR